MLITAMLAAVYLATRSLWLAMFLHAVLDLRVVGLLAVMDRHRHQGAAA